MGNQSLGVGQMSPARRSQGSSTAVLERLVLASSASPVMPSRADLEELAGLSRRDRRVVALLVERGELIETRQPPVPGMRDRPPSRPAAWWPSAFGTPATR
jgi:hypothetical protein